MLIDLPGRYESRRRALEWLQRERVAHLLLFQQVKVHEDRDAQRFKAWMLEELRHPRP